MIDVDTRTRVGSTSTPSRLGPGCPRHAPGARRPAVSFLPALTTNIHGSGAAVTFPHGYTVMLIVSVVITAAACAVGATIAGRAGLVAIPLGLGLWAITGFALILAGAPLGHHARLIDWGLTLLAAALAGAASDSHSPHGDDRRPRTRPSRRVNFPNPGTRTCARSPGRLSPSSRRCGRPASRTLGHRTDHPDLHRLRVA